MELDYNKLLSLTAEMGLCLMESGAETYRVEESMHRLLSAYGVAGEVFAIPNCIIATLTSPERRPLTQIRRVPAHGTDIDQLERYNDLCRRCVHPCKQSFRAVILACPHYFSKRSGQSQNLS